MQPLLVTPRLLINLKVQKIYYFKAPGHPYNEDLHWRNCFVKNDSEFKYVNFMTKVDVNTTVQAKIKSEVINSYNGVTINYYNKKWSISYQGFQGLKYHGKENAIILQGRCSPQKWKNKNHIKEINTDVRTSLLKATHRFPQGN